MASTVDGPPPQLKRARFLARAISLPPCIELKVVAQAMMRES